VSNKKKKKKERTKKMLVNADDAAEPSAVDVLPQRVHGDAAEHPRGEAVLLDVAADELHVAAQQVL
jgi:hypothetical protein